VDVAARLLWNERAARVKLVMPCAARSAEYEVPGAVVRRGRAGEVPGGRWARVGGARGFGFASDALYGFNLRRGAFQATLARATRYAGDLPAGPAARPWEAAADQGELRFRFLLAFAAADLPRLAAELERPPAVRLVPDHGGRLPRAGSLAALRPAALELLALKPAADGRGWILRVQNRTGRAVPRAEWTWLGRRLALGQVAAGRIVTWRLTRRGGRWAAAHCSANELEH
jgi:alpha-mannosidase